MHAWIPELWLRFEVDNTALSTLADFWRDWKTRVLACTVKYFGFTYEKQKLGRWYDVQGLG